MLFLKRGSYLIIRLETRKYLILLYYKSHSPQESQDNILHKGQIVHPSVWVHQLLPEVLVTPVLLAEEAPVHLKIPENSVESGNSLRAAPGKEEALQL